MYKERAAAVDHVHETMFPSMEKCRSASAGLSADICVFYRSKVEASDRTSVWIKVRFYVKCCAAVEDSGSYMVRIDKESLGVIKCYGPN